MTHDQFFDLLYSLIVGILDSPDVTIIRSYPAAPAPKGRYIVIDDTRIWRPIGQRSVGDSNGTTRLIAYDYEVTTGLTECGGTGELVLKILESISRDEFRDLLNASNVSLMRIGAVNRRPVLLDKFSWQVDYTSDVIFGLTRATTEVRPTIESIVVTGEVGDNNITVEAP